MEIKGLTSENPAAAMRLQAFAGSAAKVRYAAESIQPAVFNHIYQEEINIAVWRRKLPEKLQLAVRNFLASNPTFEKSLTVTARNALASINRLFGVASQPDLSEDIAELVDRFCELFDLKQARLRLTVLDRAMCPRFHVDYVTCRLLTSYQGAATEWLPDLAVNRAKLGTGNGGRPDNESGLYKNRYDIQQLNCGDVALLKGARWEGNENSGLVHRSPAVENGEYRLLLALDFI